MAGPWSSSSSSSSSGTSPTGIPIFQSVPRIVPKQNIDNNQTYSSYRYLSTTTTGTRDDITTPTATTTSLLNLSSPTSNVPLHIAEKILSEQPKLYQTPPHPLHTIKKHIEDFFPTFVAKDSLSPIVSTHANFDSLLIPSDHVSRSRSDTYYINDTTCLRTHTSAHQVQLLKEGYTQFLCTGDVYRRDDIDKSHYPIFHQMEGVKVFDSNVSEDEILLDLKSHLERLAQHLFGPVECRWVDEYFPFTHPSLELEIWYQEEWLEVLGCGVMQPQILKDAGLVDKKGWAFGLGLERLAMVLFQIPDIRLFWSQDERFWKQFQSGQITTFQPYSKYPPCFKDISFWIQDIQSFHVNDVLDLTRQVAGDLVEQVQMVDRFVHPKTQRESHCYRITYRSMDRSLTNAEIDILQDNLRSMIADQLPIELR